MFKILIPRKTLLVKKRHTTYVKVALTYWKLEVRLNTSQVGTNTQSGAQVILN